MALIKDGKIYRTLEEQVGYLTKKQGEQDEINADLQEQINDKEDKLTFDSVPTDGSTNPVESNGIYDALQNKEDKINIIEISSTSGTLTDEQYNLLSKNNTLIKYSNSYMQKIFDSSMYYRFANIHYEVKYYLFEVTKSTKEYTITNKAYNVLEDGVKADITGDIVGKVLTVNSSYKSEWKTPEIHDSNIISDNMASGYVLTSNGSNGATWQAPSGGNFEHYVEVNVDNGTLSDTDYNKLTYNDSVFVYNNSGTKQLYDKHVISNSSLIFERILPAISQCERVYVSISTKAYYILTFNIGGIEILTLSSVSGTLSDGDYAKVSGDNCVIEYVHSGYSDFLFKAREDSYIWYRSVFSNPNNSPRDTYYYIFKLQANKNYTINAEYLPITSDSIKSGSATSGQVLTANGSGGASWQTAGGGGSTLYSHNFKIEVSGIESYGTIISSSATQFNASSLITYLYNNGITLNVSGAYYSNEDYLILSISSWNGTQMQFSYYRFSNHSFASMVWSAGSITITDVVTTL